MTLETIELSKHPQNLDPTATLISGFWEDGLIFRVRGGFLVAPKPGRAIVPLFATEAEARAALAKARQA